MKKIEIKAGQKFGKLTAIERTKNINGRQTWKCICECGNIVYRDATSITRDYYHACLHCSSVHRATKHNMCKSQLYNIYNNMKQRCYNKNRPDYKWYGNENKTIYSQWLGKNGFVNFQKWANENGYKEGLTIDRIDTKGNYEPSNCRWVSNIVQKNNTRRTHYITYNGETHTIAEWARIYEVDYEHFRGKVRKYEKTDVNNIFKDLTRR